MKKEYGYILALLLFSLSSIAQVKITATTDVLNAVVGSKPTNNQPSLNLLASVRITDPYSGFTISPSVEVFNAIEYTKFGIGVGKMFISGNHWEYSTILEATQTIRYDKAKAYIGYGILNYVDYRITKKIYLTALLQTLKRTDIDKLYNDSNSYRVSGFLGLTLKLN